jgi:YHS domain-containing protein
VLNYPSFLALNHRIFIRKSPRVLWYNQQQVSVLDIVFKSFNCYFKILKKMKNIKSVLLALMLIITANTVFAQNFKANHNTDDSKIALQGYSAVSYLDLGIAQKGVKDFKVTHDGLNYYFTSKEQKAKFEANPTNYLPQVGGYCAFGVSVGAKFRTDPNKFVVKNGKYFLFLYDLEVDAQQLWLAGNHDELVAKAEANWKKLSKEQ